MVQLSFPVAMAGEPFERAAPVVAYVRGDGEVVHGPARRRRRRRRVLNRQMAFRWPRKSRQHVRARSLQPRMLLAAERRGELKALPDKSWEEARPKLRCECDGAGKACPWCGDVGPMRIKMRVGPGEDPAGPNISCQACGKQVAWQPDPVGDHWEWVRIEEGEDGVVNAADLPDRVLNHCRPCLRLSCRHNLAVEVQEVNVTGQVRPLKLLYPDKDDPWQPDWDAQPCSCVLDAIKCGPDGRGEGISLEEIGRASNRCVERVRQLLNAGLYASKIRMRWAEQHASGLPKTKL